MAFPAPAPVAQLVRRLVAFLLDGLFLVPVYFMYAVALDSLFGVLVEADPGGAGFIVVAVDPLRVAVELTLTLVTDAAYYAGSWSRWGMTPGQRVLRIAVRTVGPGVPPGAGEQGSLPHDPDRVPAPAAAARWAVLQLLPLCVGTLGASGALSLAAVGAANAAWFGLLFVTAAADPLRRGLHDRAAGTVVVRAPIRARR